jgi:hypothetical protein
MAWGADDSRVPSNGPAAVPVVTGQTLAATACSFGWWLMSSADLFWEKSTVGWLLVAGLFWVADKPSEQPEDPFWSQPSWCIPQKYYYDSLLIHIILHVLRTKLHVILIF